MKTILSFLQCKCQIPVLFKRHVCKTFIQPQLTILTVKYHTINYTPVIRFCDITMTLH